MSARRPIGLGLRCRRERVIAATVQRGASLRARVATLPDSLTVHAHFACHRWHARCGEVRVNDYGTIRAAVYAAAQEAAARLLGEGVPLRCIHLSATNDAHVYVARYNAEAVA